VDDYRQRVANRLKTARGHLDGVLRMVADDAYCPDVMKQLAAVQGLLEGTSRLVFRNHLETCVATAMREGRTEEIVDELMETLKYDKRVLRPTPEADAGMPAPPPTEGASMATETISVPEIHCGHCKSSIEGALSPLEGVSTATVDVDAKAVTVEFDDERVSRADLVSAIEAQGYDVP
jgi:CsoR family transcriptional regulator, copper-sensing transcriptional repressor